MALSAQLFPWLVPFGAGLIFLVIQYISYKSYQESMLEQFSKEPSKTLIKLSDLLYNKIRLIIYGIGLSWALIGFFAGYFIFGSVQKELLTFWVRFLGISAFIWFIAVLIPGLLNVYFPRFALNSLLIFGRRALGKVTFFIGLAHATLAFEHNYKGSVYTYFGLSDSYKLAVILGLAALIILFLMTITSFDRMMHLLSFKRWKMLHRLVYLAILFGFIHAFIRGTSFKDQVFSLSMLTFAVLFILLELGATGQMLWRHRKYRALGLSWFYLGILSFIGIFTLMFSLLQAEKIIGS